MNDKELIKEIILEIEFLNEDDSIPRNLRNLINSIEEKLEKECDTVKISSILYDLEEITNNNNMPQFCRSTVWSLISKLEILKEKLK